MNNFLLLIVRIVSLFLETVRKHDDCPDGICDEPIATAATLTAQLRSPKVSFGVFDLYRFFKCIPMDRVYAVGKRIFNLFKGCEKCPDDGCSFFDLLGCFDLTEAVSIAKEILAIISESRMCDGDDGGEITLGQATAT